MAIYIASDMPLPEIAWDSEAPAFYVTADVGPNERELRRHVTKPFVYYVGSHSGCGCGFSYGEYEEPDVEEDGPDWVFARKSVADLAAYLERALQLTPELELYSCWDGEEGEAEESRTTISPDEIGGERFWFEERQLTVVRLAGSGSPSG